MLDAQDCCLRLRRTRRVPRRFVRHTAEASTIDNNPDVLVISGKYRGIFEAVGLKTGAGCYSLLLTLTTCVDWSPVLLHNI